VNKFLSKIERKDLEEAHRVESSRRHADRIKTILLLDSDWPVNKIAEALLLDTNTIRRYRELYKDGGIDNLRSDNYLGRSSKLSEKEEESLKKELRRKIYLCTTEIIGYIKITFKVDYSHSGITYLLHRLGFSYKKPNLVPGKSNEEDQKVFLKELTLLKNNKKPRDKLYYIDGVHPQHNSLPSYGWLPKGEETKLKSNTGRQRANISGALDAETHEVIVQEHFTLNAETTIKFFKFIESKNKDTNSIYLVLDNAGYYKGEKIREFLKTSKIKLVFLPPYAPNLNLIERLWKFFKKQVLYNQYYKTFSEFKISYLNFFKKSNLNRFKTQLDSLLTDNFQIVSA